MILLYLNFNLEPAKFDIKATMAQTVQVHGNLIVHNAVLKKYNIWPSNLLYFHTVNI